MVNPTIRGGLARRTREEAADAISRSVSFACLSLYLPGVQLSRGHILRQHARYDWLRRARATCCYVPRQEDVCRSKQAWSASVWTAERRQLRCDLLRHERRCRTVERRRGEVGPRGDFDARSDFLRGRYRAFVSGAD